MTELIHEKLVAIMREAGPIAKADKATQGYTYRSAVDVFNRMHPIMASHGVTMRCEVISHEVRERVWKNYKGDEQLLVRAIGTIKWWFVAEDGSRESTTLSAEGLAYQEDKATNKVFTVTQRQAICQTFVIPTQDLMDPEDPKHDTDTPEEAKGRGNAPADGNAISEPQAKRFWALKKKSGLTDKQAGLLLKGHGIPVQDSLGKMVQSIPWQKYKAICEELEAESNSVDSNTPVG